MQQAHKKPKCVESRILWVDEDSQELLNHSMALGCRGYPIVACDAYSMGLFLLERYEFDLIVVGQGGPSFEGRCVLEHARHLAPHSQVLILANHADVGVYLKAMDLGATDYFEKRPDPSDLIPTIEKYLRPIDRPQKPVPESSEGSDELPVETATPSVGYTPCRS
jgi:DNA-binding NtrC family response regulator